MSIKRRSNWPAALDLFLQEKASQPFSWTENNCAFFAGDWVAILTGRDPVADYRIMTEYALRRLSAMDYCSSLVATIAKDNGWVPCAPAFARRGDLVSFTVEERPAFGVCNGLLSAFAGPEGIVYRPTLTCQQAWRIA